MRRRALVRVLGACLTLALLLSAAASAQQPASPDWSRVEEETVNQHLDRN